MYATNVIAMRKMIDRSISSLLKQKKKERSLTEDNWISDFGSIEQKTKRKKERKRRSMIGIWLDIQRCNYHCTLNDCTNMYE